jgi:hypothetical protein
VIGLTPSREDSRRSCALIANQAGFTTRAVSFNSAGAGTIYPPETPIRADRYRAGFWAGK